MNHRNYQKELDTILEDFEKQGKVPRLLLHSCCAPCSSYVLEYLSKYFEITLYYYNPNILPIGRGNHPPVLPGHQRKPIPDGAPLS